MSFFRVFGALITLLGCCYIGFSSAAAICNEATFLRRLLRALDFMSCEIQYRLTPLPELCRKTAAECSGSLKNVFNEFAEEMDNQVSPDVKTCMAASISKAKNIPQLTRKCLLQLGASMGRFDLSGQINGIESVRAACKNYIENVEAGKTSRVRTYKTLGICAGAALVIIFV